MDGVGRRTAALALLGCLAVLLPACTSTAPQAEPSSAPSNGAATGTGPGATPSRGPAERRGVRDGWGPTEADLDRAARRVARLPLPKLAGQLIVADYPGRRAPTALVRRLHLGGVVAFGDNIASPGQARRVNRTLARETRRGWPLLTGVDQEGGRVERVKGSATRFPAFMAAGAARSPVLTRAAYRASGAELRGLGFLANFAPDADVTVGARDPAIGSRSAGSDPQHVSRQVRAAARGYLDAGILPVLKHFPGHGSVTSDSHLTLPVQPRSRRELRRRDLVPFVDAVRAGLPAIMVGHLAVPAIEPGVPTSLSRPAITGLLRGRLGFDGLVITDSLQMAAITGSPGAVALRAVRAGADVLLMPSDPAAARSALVRAVRAGRLPRRRLEASATRMVGWLLFQQRTAPRGAAPGSGRSASRDLSRASLTLTAGPCQGRLVRAAVTPHGEPAAVAAFVRAARSAGLTVLRRRTPPGSLATPEPAPEPRPRPGRRPTPPGSAAGAAKQAAHDVALRRWRKARRAYRRYLARREEWAARERDRRSELTRWRRAESARLEAGTNIGFSGPTSGPQDGEIAVATDTPYVLGGLSAPVRIATYATTPAAMAGLVEVLLGRRSAPGRLPVPMPKLPRQGC